MHGGLQNDLSSLKAYVKEEFWERMSEVSQIVEKVNKTMAELQEQTLAEKEKALIQAKSEAENLETTYLKRLEVECQKLDDAESQIANYEEYLQQVLSNMEETKNEKEMLETELTSKKEVIKSMMLEHELELDALRDQMRQEIQGKDDEIFKLMQRLSEKESEVQSILQQKESISEDLKKQEEEKDTISALLRQKESEFNEKLGDFKQYQEEIQVLQSFKGGIKLDSQAEEKSLSPVALQVLAAEKLLSVQRELAQTKEELLRIECSKSQELKDLEEKLSAKHRSEMESLRSRYRLAVSTTVMEKSVTGLPENLESETTFGPEDLKKIITENREKWEAEKEKHIKVILEEHEKKLSEAIAEAVNQENLKCNAEKNKTIASMRRECEESIEKSKTHLVAELQVSFNEAINSVTKDKDAIIEGLRSKVATLQAYLQSIKIQIDKHSSGHISAALLSQSDSGASSSYKVLPKEDESLIDKLRNEIESYLHISDQKSISGPSQEDQSYNEFLRKEKFSSQPRIGPCINCTFKISILTCDVGDLILLCYEEKYDSFVAFHLGPFVYFLHSDSLEPLGLKIPASSAEKWALGVITNKEFCVARKPSNRYKMNVGTKFYRLKVKPWPRQKAMEEFHIYRNSQSTAYFSRTLSAQSSTTEEGDGAKGMSASSI